MVVLFFKELWGGDLKPCKPSSDYTKKFFQPGGPKGVSYFISGAAPAPAPSVVLLFYASWRIRVPRHRDNRKARRFAGKSKS